MRESLRHRHFSETTRKLHIFCPHRDRTGISVHVVIRDGQCYRSEHCHVIWCKYNSLQSDLKSILSLIW